LLRAAESKLPVEKSSGSLQTVMTSIDPNPRREVDALCDSVIRKPLEDCDLEFFMSLSRAIFFSSMAHIMFLPIPM
jgi:hypothetical protein